MTKGKMDEKAAVRISRNGADPNFAKRAHEAARANKENEGKGGGQQGGDRPEQKKDKEAK
ncbi:uncharacterized protein DNG_03995 [Cephalotrichum gorgonifer]|uniref:Uncharacterized protein n=1 Tax=Cephalotrichum gorgonifer TaxID=2041049 RepID=A0AAE8MW67_9PEZI|nr:uncharacterized protein DNG_03995 [Cephalotrichum gorgonifer]